MRARGGPRVGPRRARVAGAALMIGSAALIGWLIGSPQFALDDERVELHGVAHADPAAVRAAIGLEPGAAPNLFRITTAQMQRGLAALPAVEHAEVRAVLPDRLLVEVVERTPVMVVRALAESHLVDREGVVVDSLAEDQQPPATLPVISDERRSLALGLTVGERLNETDLTAMLQLGALTPATLESAATELALSVDDDDGYVLSAAPHGWRAIFGHYTPTLRPPDMIGRQVECLAALLDEGESAIDTIYLAPLDDRCGTYLPRLTPASAEPRVSPSPSPAR